MSKSETTLYQLIVDSAHMGLGLQGENGSFPKGTNGPYKDDDTYVRTTAHWAILQYKAYEITGQSEYEVSARKACDYIVSNECRPYGFTFHCRNGNNKDKCNGLIGQAWAVEALILIGKKTGDSSYLDCVSDLFSCIRYDWKRHKWLLTGVDGTILPVCRTLNQQIWMSTMALAGGTSIQEELEEKATDFFQNLCRTSKVCKNDLLWHKLNLSVKELAPHRVVSDILHRKRITKQSVGYLSFILFGLALAYDYSSQYSFWKQEHLKTMLKNAYLYIKNRKPFGSGSDGTDYRWGYNPVGIEMAYFIQVFNSFLRLDESDDEVLYWLNMQINHHFDFEGKAMSKNTVDKAILSSRLYEATYLNDYRITIRPSKP